ARHRVPDGGARQGARPDDRHRDTHARRAAVRARRIRESRPRARDHPLTTPRRISGFFDTYTRDLKAEDLQRLFTRDTREAYRFFTRHVDTDAFKLLPWHRRLWAHVRVLFMAFTMKLSPARRIVYGASLLLAGLAIINLAHGEQLLRSTFGSHVTVIVPGL